MQISSELVDLYSDYYGQASDPKKKHLAAIDSAQHLVSLLGTDLGDLVDVGAGNGALLDRVNALGYARSLSAMEISNSGLDKIRDRPGLSLKKLTLFDGYKMPAEDQEFDTAVSVHVVEHVEHERLFLHEISRIAKKVFIEVPLEGGFRGRINRTHGHINYYTRMTFFNLLETSGLRIIGEKVFTSSRDYEIHSYGMSKGLARSVIRNGLLRAAGPKIAPHLMTYLLSVAVEKK